MIVQAVLVAHGTPFGSRKLTPHRADTRFPTHAWIRTVEADCNGEEHRGRAGTGTGITRVSPEVWEGVRGQCVAEKMQRDMHILLPLLPMRQ